MTSPKDLLTAQQYAKHAGVSTSTVSKWIRSGKLKAEKVQNKWMISADQLGSAGSSSSPKKQSKTAASIKSESIQGESNATKGNTKHYSVAEFSAMTYLTEFGVIQWLKQGRLKGSRDSAGEWQIETANLTNADIQRLLRK
jgi:excisionase family DNA binding protein